MAKAVVLLSGGLDSTVSLARARQHHTIALALNFDYGQRAARKEDRAARAIARHYRIPCQCVALPWLKRITSTALVDTRYALPSPGLRELDRRRAAEATAKAVWVPNRNGVFISIAAAVAESMGCTLIVTGFNREEAATFPDNSEAFVTAMNGALYYSTLNHVKVKSFTSGLSKPQIVRLGRRLGAPLHRVWSCYRGGRQPCGCCESCLRSVRAGIR